VRIREIRGEFLIRQFGTSAVGNTPLTTSELPLSSKPSMSAAAQVPRALDERDFIEAMCGLTLAPSAPESAVALVASLEDAQRAAFLDLAASNHVVVRALQPVAQQSSDVATRDWAADAIRAEQQRIAHAVTHLRRVCHELESAGCPSVVIKTLEHLPDLGSDLDLYTTGGEAAVVAVMRRLGATIEARSWGDRLAQKWNFKLPELPESIEIHIQRLGQTGEHTDLAKRFVRRRVPLAIDELTFFVPAPEEKIIVATLQRMYRHFYARVCDVVNIAALVDSGAVDYAELQRAADFGGIWPGVASFLVIVSDVVKQYRGAPLALAENVRHAARFGGEKIQVRGRFLRVPVMPEGAALYTEQVTKTALRGDVPATFRLSLLPPLASAAAIAFKITGSDKGIW